MEIEKIVSTAKEKLGQTSLSDRTIQSYFTSINPQGEPDEAFWQTHTSILKSLGGQYSHDVSAWQQQWQKDHPVQEHAPDPEPPKPSSIDPALKEVLDGYKAQIADMQKLIAAQQQQHSEETMRSAALAQADALNVTNKNLWNDAVSRVTVSKDMTVESFGAQVKTIYEQNLKSFLGEGVQPYGSASPTDSTAQTKATLDAFFATKGFGNK